MEKFAKVSLVLETAVPQGLIALAGNGVVDDILRGVVQGEIPAVLEIETVNAELSLVDVRPYLRQRWLDRLATNKELVKSERRRLKEIDVDDDGRITEEFLVWEIGTPVVEIEAWFK